MRITGLHIEGFGIYADQPLDGLPPGLVVLLGDNEAGKSTLLDFIRSVLFGFAKGSEKARSYPALSGGRLGGTLTLRTASEDEYRLTRVASRKGKAVGDVTIAPVGSAPDVLLENLLGGMTREVFRNVYAFSLEELRDFKALEAEQLKAVLYSASMGTGLQALPRTQRYLEEHAKALLSVDPKPIATQLERLREKQEQLKARLGLVGEYDRTWDELQEVQREITRHQAQLRVVSERVSQADLTLKAWPSWEALVRLRESLAQLPADLDAFPADGQAELERLRLLRLEKQNLVDALQSELAKKVEALEQVKVERGLLDLAEEIAALRDGRGRFLDARSLLRDLDQGIVESRETQRLALERLGAGWDVAHVRACAGLAEAGEDLLRFQKQLSESSADQVSAARAVEGQEKEVATHLEEEAETRTALEKLGPAQARTREELAQDLQSGRDRFESESAEMATLSVAVEAEQTRIAQDLGTLVPGWSRTQLEAFDPARSRALLDAVDGRQQDREKSCLQASAAVEAAGQAVREAEAARDRARSELAAMPDIGGVTLTDLETRGQALTKLRGLIQERDAAEATVNEVAPQEAARKRDLEVLRQHEGLRSGVVLLWLGVALLVAAILAGGALMAIGQKGIGMGVAAVCAITGAILITVHGVQRQGETEHLLAQRGRLEKEVQDLEARHRQAGERLPGLGQRIEETARQASMKPPFTASAAERHDQELRSLQALCESRARKEQEVSGLEQGFAKKKEEAAEKQRQLDERQADARRVSAEGQEGLRSIGLPEAWQVRDGLNAVSRLEALQHRLGLVGRQQERLKSLSGSTSAWRDLARQAGATATDSLALLRQVDDYLALRRHETEMDAQRKVVLERLGEREKALRAAREQLVELRRAADLASQACRGAEDEWRQWLRAHGLEEGLAPSVVIALAHGVKDVLTAMQREQELQEERGRHAVFLAGYGRRVEQVYQRLERPVPLPERIAAEVEELATTLDAQRQDDTRRTEMAQNVSELGESLRKQREAAEEVSRALSELLTRAGCEDEATFEQRGSAVQRRREMLREAGHLEQSLRTMTVTPDAAALAGRFEGRSREDTDEEWRRGQDEAARLREELEGPEVDGRHEGGLRNRKAELELRLEQLGSSEDIGRLRAEEESIKTQLRDLGLEWSQYRVAKHLLDEAWRRFERRAQPGVIQDAARYFDTITGGAYTEIFSPLSDEKKDFEVQSRGTVRRTVEQLSGGTQEQLYLCLRFGFINHQATVGEAAPVVMDDILVNFDPERAKRAAEAILELAGRVQVLFFTCHPHTADLFRELDAGVPVIELQAGRFEKEAGGVALRPAQG